MEFENNRTQDVTESPPAKYKNRKLRYPGLSVLDVQYEKGLQLPHDEYFLFLDDISHPKLSTSALQFESKVGIGRAAMLGGITGSLLTLHIVLLGFSIVRADFILFMWSFYFVGIMLYHFCEFLLQALYNASQTTCDQFLYNHSRAYQLAFIAAWLEFWFEAVVFGSWKASAKLVVFAGMILMIIGQAFRSLAMIHAKSNFTHLIQTEKRQTHVLVTTGVYKYLRHPSYFGWFWFVIGSQLALCNPVCLVAYVFVSWRFFKGRIDFEELTLLRFFPDEYPAYKNRTIIGIPFM